MLDGLFEILEDAAPVLGMTEFGQKISEALFENPALVFTGIVATGAAIAVYHNTSNKDKNQLKPK